MSHFLRFRLLALAALLVSPMLVAGERAAVFAQAFNGYGREKLSDGTFRQEFYVVGDGGCWKRPITDPEMDTLQFADVVRTVATPLAHVNYLPAPTAADARLLILVFWGSTEGSYSLGPQDAFGHMLDARNARILGYNEALSRAESLPTSGFSRDIIDEVGNHRYYVVLQAYDFETARKEKKLKPLWITRMSLPEHGSFSTALVAMFTDGAPYFGRKSDGLLRRDRVREGTVELGPLEVIGTEPADEAGDKKEQP